MVEPVLDSVYELSTRIGRNPNLATGEKPRVALVKIFGSYIADLDF